MTISEVDLIHLRRAVELAREALDAGDGPFGSVLVDASGAERFADRNREATTGDPTRHPEFEIARWAATNLTADERAAATVYTSGEHCPMCAAAHAWVGLGRIVYVASAEQIAGWRRELGAPPSPLAVLPVTTVAPEVPVDGPAEPLVSQVRELVEHAARGTSAMSGPATSGPPIRLPEGSTLPVGVTLRRPGSDDHASVVAVIPDWWGLPADTHLPALLPRLFFQHFGDHSFLAEDASGLAAFLIGFHSSSQPEVAYVHFVGVRPDLRQAGLARTLYEAFFTEARAAGLRRVDAITGPVNRRSQAFHRAMGFEQTGTVDIDGVPAWPDYDGPGEHRVTFTREVGPEPERSFRPPRGA